MERFIPSTEELRHWVYYGTEGCTCTEVCTQMRRRSDNDNLYIDADDPDYLGRY